MLVTSKDLFKQAQEKHFAIPAANFNNLDTLKWHAETAEELNLPIILALAEVHIGDKISLEDAAEYGKYLAEKVSVPVVLHLDHGQNPDLIKKAVDLGFTSVMIDASEDDLETNIEKTLDIINYAHPKGVVVEAEIGHVGTGSKYADDSDNVYTSVEEAKEFVDKTGVDSLAVSIGTAHGFYKGTPKINFERLNELAEAIDTPLVLHGGSSSGDENLNKCATNGITKINIWSDFLGGAKDQIEEDQPEAFLDMLDSAKKGYKDTLKHYYEVFETQPVEV